MLKVQGLTFAFDKNVVLEDVGFEAKDGSILGLVGINGAGKSTLLRAISGVYDLEKGEVTYDGQSPTDPAVRKDIFLLPDDPYFTNHTNCRNLLKLYKMLYPGLDENVYRTILSEFGLNENKPIRSFSKGMRRQAFIALAFAINPKYMLLDEAFDGLDPLARKMFKERIMKRVKENGGTVIVSSHALKELEDFCDEYILIDSKHVISSGVVLEKAMGLLKYQMAFREKPGREMFKDLPVKSLKITERFVTVVLEGEEQKIYDDLMALDPVIMDKLDVNFEEAFIKDVDRKVRGGN